MANRTFISTKEWAATGFRIGLVLLIVLFFLPGQMEALFADYEEELDDPLPERALDHYQFLRRHFEAPFDGYTATDVLIEQFSVVFLSHAALGFMNVAAASPNHPEETSTLMQEIYRRAVSPDVSPYKKAPEDIQKLGDNNLYLSHLNLILGASCTVSKQPFHDKLHRRITEHLVKRSLAHESGVARSYPQYPRFPADQAATLASLYLYDSCYGTTLAEKPIARWLGYMRAHASNKKTGLHISSVSSGFPDSRLPRGCALSWTILYMSQFAPDEARELYTRYRRHYYKHIAGWGGFREYPKGIDRAMNADSGPIVFGMGVAASGLGIGAARMFRDRRAYVSIMRTAASVGLPPLSLAGRHYLLSPLLGEAILFHGVTARRWGRPFEEAAAFDEQPPFPFGATILSLMLLLWLGSNIRKIYKRVRSMVERRITRMIPRAPDS